MRQLLVTPWSPTETVRLCELATEHLPTLRIARALRRSPSAVRRQARKLGLTLTESGRRSKRNERHSGFEIPR